MAEFKRLLPIKMWMQKTLPASFDDSLTYYEAVAKLMAKINEIIEKLNTIQDEWEQMLADTLNEANKYTDSQIRQFQIKFDTTINELNQQYASFVNEILGQMSNFKEEFKEFADHQQQVLDGMYSNLVSLINSNNAEIIKYINNKEINLIVIDYFTGRKVTPQFMFNKLAIFHCPGAITYNELADANITYNQWKEMEEDYTYLAMYGLKEITPPQPEEPINPNHIVYGHIYKDNYGLYTSNGRRATWFTNEQGSNHIYASEYLQWVNSSTLKAVRSGTYRFLVQPNAISINGEVFDSNIHDYYRLNVNDTITINNWDYPGTVWAGVIDA